MPRLLTGKSDFEREVAALSLLSNPPHEHVVRLYDLHRDSENYYLVMELLDGGEVFEEIIEQGSYSEAQAAELLRQFAGAISFVHECGLTHADLKPENLMLTSASRGQDKKKLKVVDFGCCVTHDDATKKGIAPSKSQQLSVDAQEFAQGCGFLHQAALNKLSDLKDAVAKRPNLVQFADYDHRTALHVAASEGCLEICKFLIDKGADVNAQDRWGNLPLDDAVLLGHDEIKVLLEGAGAHLGTNTLRINNFIDAAAKGSLKTVQALLDASDGKLDIDQGDYDHRTALHLASAAPGNLDMVRLLCMKGANPNVVDRFGRSPLDDAVTAGRSDIAAVLRNYGATQNSQDQQKASSAPNMIELRKELVSQSPVKESASEDEGMSEWSAKEFVLGCSALHQAAMGNQFEIEKILLQNPDMVHFRDYDRRTLLHIAASEGHLDMCRYLVNKGSNVNRCDRWGGR